MDKIVGDVEQMKKKNQLNFIAYEKCLQYKLRKPENKEIYRMCIHILYLFFDNAMIINVF